MKIYNFLQSATLTICTLLSSAVYSVAQLPDGVDAGQSDDAVSIYEQPKYIIPIVIFILAVVLIYFWQKSSKKKSNKD